MFAEGWVMYPRPVGPESTWHSYNSRCFTINLQNQRCVSPQNITETGPQPHIQMSMSSCRWWHYNDQREALGGDPVILTENLQKGSICKSLQINYKGNSYMISITFELSHDANNYIYYQNVFQMN